MFRTHEETGRKAVYVNRLMTMKLKGLPEDESERLLNALWDHSERPEFGTSGASATFSCGIIAAQPTRVQTSPRSSGG